MQIVPGVYMVGGHFDAEEDVTEADCMVVRVIRTGYSGIARVAESGHFEGVMHDRFGISYIVGDVTPSDLSFSKSYGASPFGPLFEYSFPLEDVFPSAPVFGMWERVRGEAEGEIVPSNGGTMCVFTLLSDEKGKEVLGTELESHEGNR